MEERASCPFCEGREDRTPPESFALGPPGRESDTPGWTVRVVPNLYPAFARHEVVVHTPRHLRSFAALEPGEVGAVAAAWRQRAAAAREAGRPYQQAVINEGREAGASLPHSHSQLVWLPEPPPLVAAELMGDGSCAVCDLLGRADRDGLGVAAHNGVAAVAPYASRSPYELLVAPQRHEGGAFEPGSALDEALELVRQVLGRLQRLEGDLPLNIWLHDGRHWHLELVPRLSTPASLELGAGIYINSLLPEEAAARLRSSSP